MSLLTARRTEEAAGPPGGWLPPDVATLGLWLDAEQITGLSDGDPVTTWPDESGNARDAVAAVNASYHVNVLNGLPVVRSAGSSRLETVGYAPGSTATADMTYFFVAKTTNTSGHLAATRSGNSVGWGLFWLTTSTVQLYFTGGGGDAIDAVAPNANHNLWTFRKRGLDVDYAVNAAALATGTKTWGLDATEGMALFGRYNNTNGRMTGDIAEIVVYDSAISDPDLANARTYLLNKWGIP